MGETGNYHLTNKKCPKCGIQLLTDAKEEDYWCPLGTCDFDTRKLLSEKDVYGNDCRFGTCNV